MRPFKTFVLLHKTKGEKTEDQMDQTRAFSLEEAITHFQKHYPELNDKGTFRGRKSSLRVQPDPTRDPANY